MGDFRAGFWYLTLGTLLSSDDAPRSHAVNSSHEICEKLIAAASCGLLEVITKGDLTSFESIEEVREIFRRRVGTDTEQHG